MLDTKNPSSFFPGDKHSISDSRNENSTPIPPAPIPNPHSTPPNPKKSFKRIMNEKDTEQAGVAATEDEDDGNSIFDLQKKKKPAKKAKFLIKDATEDKTTFNEDLPEEGNEINLLATSPDSPSRPAATKLTAKTPHLPQETPQEQTPASTTNPKAKTHSSTPLLHQTQTPRSTGSPLISPNPAYPDATHQHVPPTPTQASLPQATPIATPAPIIQAAPIQDNPIVPPTQASLPQATPIATPAPIIQATPIQANPIVSPAPSTQASPTNLNTTPPPQATTEQAQIPNNPANNPMVQQQRLLKEKRLHEQRMTNHKNITNDSKNTPVSQGQPTQTNSVNAANQSSQGLPTSNIDAEFSGDISLDAESITGSETFAEDLSSLVDQLVEKVHVSEVKGKLDLTFTIKYPPIFENASVTVTEYDTAEGEYNLTFANLKPEAKELLDLAINRGALKQALEEKGFTVHIIVTTEEPIETDLREGSEEGLFDEDDNQQNQQDQLQEDEEEDEE